MPSRSSRGKNIRRATAPAVYESLEGRVLFASVAFAAPVTTQISSGVFPVSATAVGDLNGDGIPDLIAARDNLQAQVYLGAKTGVFTLGSIYGSGGNFVALGDFNGDGKLDLATGDGIYPGVGDGTFGTLITGFSLPVGTINMYAQDVNNDGNLDLVCVTYVAASGTANSTPTIGVSVLLGNGNGTFKGAVNTPIGSAAGLTQADATVSFGDFNGDGNLDILSPLGVMLGNGDGTFNKATALPFKGLAAGASTLPAAPIFAIGDFNGDGFPDLATIPASGNAGQVEIFLNNGKGAFTDAGPITVGTNETITALDAEFLNTTGGVDLLAGISNSPGTQTGSSDLAILTGNGDGTFATPTLYAVSGPPVSFTTGDFNADSNPDIISIDGIAGSTTSTGLTLAASAAVLINSQAALSAPVVTLHTSANPTVDGDSVKYTVAVTASATATTTALPTGTVTFSNGSAMIGTASLVNGKASITITAAGVGIQTITASYGGDVNYTGATSTALSQTVLETGAKVPLLLPTLGAAITLPAEFLKGDSGNATITLTNGGGAIAHGKIDVNFYLSQSGLIDSSAIALPVPALQNHAVQIGSGQTVSLTAHLKLGSYAPGNYFLVADVTPVTNLTTDDVSSTPVVSTTTFQAAGLVFGSVGNHHGLTLKVADASGQVASFLLTGPGTGTITQANGTTDLAVTGTTTASRLTITSRGAFTLDSADVRGALNSFTAVHTTLAGDLNLGGGVNHLSLGSVSAASGAATIDVAAGTVKPTLSLGAVGDLALTAAGPIGALSAKSWQSGAVDARGIASMNIAGSFGADVRLHAGGKLTSARIGAVTGGIWAVAGGIGTLHIIGSIASASIYAGADTGPDNLLGDGDDVFAAAAIGTLFIGASDTSTLIAAGATPATGSTTITGGIALLPKGSITAITLRGAVSDDSRILAAHLPRIVTLNGAKVATATDPHFQV
ncbi:MAG TPA: FG-GAP-like repeat-containing protein [Tepidisphaeraceae bacterium]|nr:FG-GAP-like repeat-containing protein [Tepidisphaeraceae bacterium]